NLVGAGAGAPIASLLAAVDGDDVHLGEIPVAVEMRHRESAQDPGRGSGQDLSVNHECVVTPERSVRTPSLRPGARAPEQAETSEQQRTDSDGDRRACLLHVIRHVVLTVLTGAYPNARPVP